MTFEHALHNGKLVALSDAVAPLENIGFVYGFGVYESVRVHEGTAMFLDDHMQRLDVSASTIGLEHSFTQEQLHEWTTELIAACGDGVYNFKYLLLGGRTADDAQLWILPSNPRFVDRKLYRDGASLMTASGERALPTAKTLNMLPSYLAYTKARRQGYADALFVHHDGVIREATTANLFTLEDEVLRTPADENVLAGVTRKYVLEVARSTGLTIEYTDFTLDSLLSAQDVFITSTGKKILPISRIDDTKLGAPSEQLRSLMNAFDEFLDRARE